MAMPNRQIQNGQPYRYAYQGQEKDPETGKEAFQLRLWDGRIGRWLTTDPAGQYSSPYLGMGNNPMNGTDPDGAEWIPDENGNLIAEANDNAGTLATHLGITEGAAQKMIDSQGLLTDFTNTNGTGLMEHQVLTLDNVYTRALSNSNGTLTTDKFLNNLETGSRDFVIGSKDRYNCFGSCLSGASGQEINNTNSNMSDPFYMEKVMNNSYYKVNEKNAVFGTTVITFGNNIMLTHAAIFYGRSNDGTVYLFTKNGSQVKPEIMPLNDLLIKTNSELMLKQDRYGKVKGYYKY